jgi:hypothetical protein
MRRPGKSLGLTNSTCNRVDSPRERLVQKAQRSPRPRITRPLAHYLIPAKEDREGLLRWVDIDRKNAARACHPQPHDHGEADSAEAKDSCRRPWLNLLRSEGGGRLLVLVGQATPRPFACPPPCKC